MLAIHYMLYMYMFMHTVTRSHFTANTVLLYHVMYQYVLICACIGIAQYLIVTTTFAVLCLTTRRGSVQES